ncbi:putative vacuolar import/degradation protein Vid24 [Septoria linicola]|nr:putative vacuolar import/degradation protein Vid24 [Septoria linicola]
MPTPSDDHLALPLNTATAEIETVRPGCPPEDRRDQHSARDELVEPSSTSGGADEASHHDQEVTEPMQMPTPDSDGPESDAPDDTIGSRGASRTCSKGEPAASAGAVLDASSSPVAGSQSPQSESDVKAAQLAQSLSNTAISPARDNPPTPLYLQYPELDRCRQLTPSSTTSFLRPGSKFRGTQQSDRQVYDVQVELKDVDVAESTLCGYLRIQGLTDDHPTLTTFFEGEIIGPKYLFQTSHLSWGSTPKVDLQHWARFPAWRPLAKAAKQDPTFTLNRSSDREHMFMRWKEYFLVPDHRVKTITGASFEGFYYICFNQATGAVSGIYFHAKSEKYQQLELRHVEDRGCLSAVEFR